MFALDPKLAAQIEPTVRRVLIVDANMMSAKLMAEIMRTVGARDVVFEQDEKQAFDAARDLEPTIIFTERAGPRMDGESFVKRIRRSSLACRKAPVIMVTADATATTIKGARDAGVHEFLRKPFTSADLFKRVEVIALRPRNWIEAVGYVGPDRRRFNSAEFKGDKKRSGETGGGETALIEMKDQAMRIVAAAFDQFDHDPAQALRALAEQATTLKALAMTVSDSRLAVAASVLEGALAGAPTRPQLAAPIAAVLALKAPVTNAA